MKYEGRAKDLLQNLVSDKKDQIFVVFQYKAVLAYNK